MVVYGRLRHGKSMAPVLMSSSAHPLIVSASKMRPSLDPLVSSAHAQLASQDSVSSALADNENSDSSAGNVQQPFVAFRRLDSIAEFQSSRQSPSVDSPPGYGDSPHSASFPSHSELDDFIIDEILSLEDDQMARKKDQPTPSIPASYSYADNLAMAQGHSSSATAAGRPIPVASNATASTSPKYNRQVSSSAPSSSLDMDSLVRQEVVCSEQEFFRDRRKKDIHNMIERRRRYNINDRIKELGMMLPKHSSEEAKLNKGTILKASCEYIRQLQRDRDHMLRLQHQHTRLESAARIYAQRVKELEAHMQKSGLSVPPPSAVLPALSFVAQTRAIKQEPPDELSISPDPNQSPGFMSQLSDGTAAMAITSPTGVLRSDRQPHRLQQSSVAADVSSASSSSHFGSFFSAASGGIASADVDRDCSTPSFCTPQLNTPQIGQMNAPPKWSSSVGASRPNNNNNNSSSQDGQQQQYSDLMMDLSSMQSSSPLLQGDPMISAAGGGPSPHHRRSRDAAVVQGQMSPDVQWDQSGFSPDSDQQQQQQQTQTQTHTNQMDFS